ncbi:efflux RND transporter periplasmic adaptor subunit [Elizabethkingia meningoseptica]|uniref:efflux RND transporter periplasmic adaptor subunit n=1 Tax=Elizabethkingia meningoseptica TaxID=238 RepID=UPI002011A294|nr:efflux RND transporter periplasmic adaptor subunit [Elizabethkingia meningoseptica]MCL1675404.1 HlyD family efflux transporter periplasmic adaptor subunit [Elizabethkingia meningoseptica]MCL1687180.1 HlyD family efflux transporter periplasmic adaptor subunit [Elizabethkingia meningoseptica]MDE5430811.1 HlyD family efflux transporter periplasmic adaptor subunit [Elizabethkingia meningoseptica]MDE5490819.1 HlyD family efflux transporter periplasmic adaptor subunit [Elizabethkingia meningosepti
MDTKIEKKKSKLKIILLAVAGVIILGLFLSYFFQQKKTFNVKEDDLQTGKVSKGKFEDMMMITAQTQSLNSSLVNVMEGGAVKEIFTEDGKMVTKGEPLARVYNPNTEFNFMSQETGIMQQISQMRNTLLELKNQEFTQNKEILQAQNDYNTALQNYNLQKRLYDAEIGKKTDFDMAQQNLSYQQKRKQIVEQSIINEKNSRASQISAVNTSIMQMEKSLDVLRNNKNNFLIMAPASGRLSSFSISLGQSLTTGQSIGKIDLMDGYKLVAKIDEYYINKLQAGIKGTLESNGKEYEVIVSKVLPEVVQGQFSAELNFVDEKPESLKIGMTFGVKLKLSADTQSLMIPKGSFFKDTNGKWIFVVEKGKAVRRNISLGRENPLYYEVLTGLKEGEQVIISDYSDYKKYEILDIKK